MKKFILSLAAILALGFAVPAQQPPGVNPAPAPVPKHLPRGARPSPKWKAFVAPKFLVQQAIPSFFGNVPKQLSCWGNCDYGDCVSAEEAFKLAVYSIQMGAAETFIPEADLVAWAKKYGYLNGAILTDVMDTMVKYGLTSGGVTYKDGPYSSVDFSSDATLSAAIYQGPVKIGVAASQLENAVNSTNQESGWWLTGATADQNEDHCVCLLGYGSAADCAKMLGVAVPSGVSATDRCYLLGTWGTIGIIDQASLLNICSEAWLRSPSTLPAPNPQPSPVPVPPTPPSPPTPTPVPPSPPTVYTIPLGDYTIASDGKNLIFTPIPATAVQTINFPTPVSSIKVVTPAPALKKAG